MMNKDLWSVVLVAFSAFFVYQFGRRSKGIDSFLESLNYSYENLYYPMYMVLKNIKERPISEREQLVSDYFKIYSSSDSNLKLIASTFILEKYFDLEKKYKNSFANQDELIRSGFWKCFDSYYLIIENEFWEAHDIIYKDYLKSKTIINRNPLLRILMEISVLVYNVITFAVYTILAIMYLSIWNLFTPISIFPSWWEIKHAIFLLLVVLILYGFVLMISSWYVFAGNKRKSELRKLIGTSTGNHLTKFTDYIKQKLNRTP